MGSGGTRSDMSGRTFTEENVFCDMGMTRTVVIVLCHFNGSTDNKYKSLHFSVNQSLMGPKFTALEQRYFRTEEYFEFNWKSAAELEVYWYKTPLTTPIIVVHLGVRPTKIT
jgi:hypothetical protein